MRVLICGKGGCGKSTLSALISRALTNRGYRVLLVDADESNYGLHHLMGFPVQANLMDDLGGRKKFKESLNKGFQDGGDGFSSRMDIDSLPDACIFEEDGISLLVIGKIHDFGDGCACPIGLLSKTVLSKLILGEKDVVIIDTEAGLEHFGRRVDAECDLILGVIDPTYESVMLSKKMESMADSAGKNIFFILNKVDPEIEKSLKARLNQDRIIARIPNTESIFQDSLEGRKLQVSIPEIDSICRLVESQKLKKPKPTLATL
jgi:CO dehydrogenase maturation factor